MMPRGLRRPRQVYTPLLTLRAPAAVPTERTLVPNDDARLGERRFEDWLSRPVPQK